MDMSENQIARRRFLASCGKFAVVTPTAVTLLLAASEQNFATAASGGQTSGGDTGLPPDFCGIITPICHPNG
jgi:hypothetical protein